MRDSSVLSDYLKLTYPDRLFLANGASIPIVGRGSVMGFPAEHVPDLTSSLLSVSSTCAQGHVCIFQRDRMYAIRRTSDVDDALRDLVSLCERQSLITFTAAQSSGLYRLDSPATASAGYYHASTRLNNLAELVRFFHECWGHPSADQMCRIVSGSLFTNIPPTLS